MVVRKNVRSTVKKDPLYVDEYHVYVVEGQKEVKENVGKDNEFIGYEVATETEYTKDEYIQMVSDKNSSLENGLINAQIALTEMYEKLG